MLDISTHFSDFSTMGGLSTLSLGYSALGVVYGDIGTSPLYTLSTVFQSGSPSDPNVVLGAASMIFWTIVAIVGVKYILITLAADDNGEGGIVALWALLCRATGMKASASFEKHSTDDSLDQLGRPGEAEGGSKKLAALLRRSKTFGAITLGITMVASNLVLSDGVLTPAISVVSATEGMVFKLGGGSTAVTLCSVAILFALFAVQSFGTSRISSAFSPAMIAWFASIAGVGLYDIVTIDPTVFKALSPHYAYYFWSGRSTEAWKQLGAILLSVTGAEALFADLGHFGRPGITLGFAVVVWPALTLSYLGQTAFLLKNPGAAKDVFWESIPSGAYWPVAILAFVAAVIASQAMITAAFSAVDQASKLDLFPRVSVRHTSETVRGQVYSPSVNWMLFLGAFSVVLGFGSSARLADAYGLAVVLVMFLDTFLVALVTHVVWKWNFVFSSAFWLVFSVVTGAFMTSSMLKIPTGAWFPLLLCVVMTFVTAAWRRGRGKRAEFERSSKNEPGRVFETSQHLEKGLAIHYVSEDEVIPETLKLATHDVVVLVTNRRVPAPSVGDHERFAVRRLPREGFYRVLARYGYVDAPTQGSDFAESVISEIRDFIGRERVVDVETGSPAGSNAWSQRPKVLEESHSLPVSRPARERFIRRCETTTRQVTSQRLPIPSFETSCEISRFDDAVREKVVVMVGKTRTCPGDSKIGFSSAMDDAFETLEKLSFTFVDEYKIASEKLVSVMFYKRM